MTLVRDRAALWHAGTPTLERLDPGVARLRGAEGAPVVIVDETPELRAVAAVAVPLLARRHEIYRLSPQGSPADAASTLAEAFGRAPVAVVGGAFAARLASLLPALAAVVIVDAALSADAEADAEADADQPGSGPLLVIAPHDADLDALPWPDARTAVAVHAAEIAHLIDSHLRAPGRHAPGARLPRVLP